MTKSVTVNFDDGTSHTYDNVPDEVTDDQVSARASDEFADKTVSGVGGGTPTPLDQGMGSYNQETTLGQKAIAAGQTALNLGNEAVSSPLGHAAEAYLGYKKVAKPLLDKYLETRAGLPTGAPVGTPTGAPPTAPVEAPRIQVPQNVGSGPRPAVSPGAQQTFDLLKAPNATVAPTPAPTVGGPAAQEGSTFIQRMTQQFAPMAEKVAPALGRVAANPIVQGAGRVLSSPITLGASLMSHSAPLGPAVPEVGPHRGMEINPTTNRPWTAQELEAEKHLHVH